MPASRFVAAFLVFLAAGVELYWPIFSIRPLSGDNLYALAWVHSASLWDILRGDSGIYPEWRPLAYLTVWLEHHAGGLDVVPLHFVANLGILATCAALAHRIAFALSGSALGAYIAGALVIVDRRTEESLAWIIERQMLLACAFGLTALLILVEKRDHALSRRWIAIVAVLLLASMLSKEYGAAFAIAIAVYGTWHRRSPDLLAAAASLAVYVGLRFLLAGGAIAPYCEEMGFGFSTTYHCMDVTTGSVAQMLYNASASLVAIAVPGLFTVEGVMEFERHRAVMGLVIAAFSIVALKHTRPALVMFLLLALATAALNFMLFRSRNQLVGVIAVSIMAGVGAAFVVQQLVVSPSRARGMLRTAIFLVLLAIGCRRAYLSQQIMITTASELGDEEPCESPMMARRFIRDYAAVVHNHYGSPAPECRPVD